jgi:hypothetical protein
LDQSRGSSAGPAPAHTPEPLDLSGWTRADRETDGSSLHHQGHDHPRSPPVTVPTGDGEDAGGTEIIRVEHLDLGPMGNVDATPNRIDRDVIEVFGVARSGTQWYAFYQVIPAAGRTLGSITGFKRCHGVALVPELNKGFITDGDAAQVVVFDIKTMKTSGAIKTYPDTDSITYDPSSKLVFTFNGDSKNLPGQQFRGIRRKNRPREKPQPKSSSRDAPLNYLRLLSGEVL